VAEWTAINKTIQITHPNIFKKIDLLSGFKNLPVRQIFNIGLLQLRFKAFLCSQLSFQVLLSKQSFLQKL
jgi:hypothetical protein